ncbi:ATP phosphoribosyltransferase regulatory subunit, partial [Candidatus Babeliales bacterium]|nr:ATP phosphoribosyltransferase regulatory subunit [Candidatus Babeliales bacterium]
REQFKKTLLQFLEPHQEKICETCQTRLTKNILRIFDCKSIDCQKVYATAPRLTDSLSEDSEESWNKVQSLLKELQISFLINPSLVRGLDYYSGIVFEFSSDHLGAQSAFCGGGRYELSSQLDGPEVPSMGAAIGIGRLLMIQEAEEKVLCVEKKELIAVLPLSKEQHEAAMNIYTQLIDANIKTELILNKKSIKSLFKKADALQAHSVVIIGEDEVTAHLYVLKNMKTGNQKTYSINDLILAIKE